jgi:hypothetical protein
LTLYEKKYKDRYSKDRSPPPIKPSESPMMIDANNQNIPSILFFSQGCSDIKSITVTIVTYVTNAPHMVAM